MDDPVCDVVERPWKDNKQNVSSIPRGVYSASVVTKQTKAWMKDRPQVAWRLELVGTGKRTNIQFHYGKDVAWSEGCFIVGLLLQPSDGAGMSKAYCQLQDSEGAIARLRAAVTTTGRSATDIKIGVTDSMSLFSDYSEMQRC